MTQRSIHDVSNIIRTDSYKVTHWLQTPPGLEYMYSYLESRGGLYDSTVMFGLNYYLKEYLSKPITMADIDYAEKRFEAHFGNKKLFNRKGFERIVNVHGGFWPVIIKAVPEGLVVPTHNVLVTIENTDRELPFATNYIETMVLKIWYSITVATISYNIKKLILKYLNETGDPSGIDFKLHDFGYRGVSSEESAAIGGMAHLINFKGSDTMLAFEAADMYYGEEMASFSIPASEHGTITAWGCEFEYEAYQNMIKQFGDGMLYAVVSDSYDIFNASEIIWGIMLKEQVLAAPGTLVIRPDSGIPHVVVLQIAEILGKKFGYTTNAKGFKVINKVRIIQGDGINENEIDLILNNLKVNGWSADNVAFGMGGALLQQMNRDTQRFAFKASSIVVNGRIKDVWKAPVTDPGKNSKRGRLKLIDNGDSYETVQASDLGHDMLQTVWRDGKLWIDPTLAEIRERVNSHLTTW